jgi:hypothetical protein
MLTPRRAAKLGGLLANPSRSVRFEKHGLGHDRRVEPPQDGRRTVIGRHSVVLQNVLRAETPVGALTKSIDAA